MVPLKVRIKRIALIFFFLAFLPLAFHAATREGLFRLSEIEVIPNQGVEPAFEDYFSNLKNQLGVFRGANIWEVKIEAVLAVVTVEPWVASAKVYRRFPHTLRVELVAKTPVAITLSKRGKLQLLSDDGALLPPIRETRAPKLPVISDARLIQTPDLHSKVIALLRELPATGRLSRESLSAVTLSKDGEIWLQHLATKSAIKLGEDQVSLRSARVEKVLEYLEHNNINSRVIDADFSKKVLVKLRNDR